MQAASGAPAGRWRRLASAAAQLCSQRVQRRHLQISPHGSRSRRRGRSARTCQHAKRQTRLTWSQPQAERLLPQPLVRPKCGQEVSCLTHSPKSSGCRAQRASTHCATKQGTLSQAVGAPAAGCDLDWFDPRDEHKVRPATTFAVSCACVVMLRVVLLHFCPTPSGRGCSERGLIKVHADAWPLARHTTALFLCLLAKQFIAGLFRSSVRDTPQRPAGLPRRLLTQAAAAPGARGEGRAARVQPAARRAAAVPRGAARGAGGRAGRGRRGGPRRRALPQWPARHGRAPVQGRAHFAVCNPHLAVGTLQCLPLDVRELKRHCGIALAQQEHSWVGA